MGLTVRRKSALFVGNGLPEILQWSVLTITVDAQNAGHLHEVFREVQMNSFDPRNVNCPHCKQAKLRAIEDSGQIIAYICAPSCGSCFDRDYHVDFECGIIYYLAKRRNPDYLSKLNSKDIYENLKKSEELKRAGVPFYTNTYVIGYKKFDEEV